MSEENLQAAEPAEAAIPPTEVEEQEESATSPESEGAEKPEVEEKPKPKGGFQRRIDELTRNWREAERRNDELLSVLKQNTVKEEPPAPAGTPTLEQYGYDEGKYQAALTEYVRGLTQAEARAVIREEQQKLQQEQRTQTFRQREAEYAATVEDYAEKVYDPTLPLSQTMVELISESDLGPKVAYYLADNPDIARSMYAMTPTQAAREFGRLEARLSSPVSTKSVSKAPPPPPKITSGDKNTLPSSADDPESDNLSMQDWLKLREKQLRRKG